ncbi:hypothetical protein DPEC_G00346070 [Dallia pectoralis]|uniref:Uncharacterized protein n=1 Tax=Dallia pectoralis TaxID=75939 RepID=A0ACC2F3P2_DALPE|nr:hypothetical protein DPEC_G00346070 [Dallia pectoralis]
MAALRLILLGISAKYFLVECQNQCEDTKFFPMNVFGPSNVTEGITIHLRCQTNYIKVSWEKGNVYLCKDGVGIQIGTMKKDGESVFELNEAKKQDSGMYSCVYSECKLPPSQVNSTGNGLRIQVNRDKDGKDRYKIRVPLVLLVVSVLVLVLLCGYWGNLKTK